jgi:integrase
MKLKLQSGSIQKKNGGWHWRYYEDGKQKSVKLAEVSDEFRSKQDVIPIANDMAARIQPHSDKPRTGNITVVQFAEAVYLPWMREQKRPATYSGSKRLWTGRLRDHFGERRLSEYQPYHATEYLTGLAREGLGSQVSHARALMSGIFAHAVALGHLRMNPIHDCKLLVRPKERTAGLHYTVEEMRAILAGLRSEPKALVAMALAFVGLNRAEIRGVKWEDVDTVNGVIHVRRSVWGKDLVSEGGKSARRLRNVSIGPLLCSILEQYRKSVPSGSGYLLENSAGHPLELGQYSTRTIRPLFKKLGLEWKGYHAGRRGAETAMANSVNGNAQVVAHHFGHSMEVAMEHYIMPVPEETRRAALALDGELSTNKGQQGTENA